MNLKHYCENNIENMVVDPPPPPPPPLSTINTTLTNEWEQPNVPYLYNSFVFRREKNTKSFVNYILLFTLYLYVMYVAWD